MLRFTERFAKHVVTTKPPTVSSVIPSMEPVTDEDVVVAVAWVVEDVVVVVSARDEAAAEEAAVDMTTVKNENMIVDLDQIKRKFAASLSLFLSVSKSMQ